jgi:hypothetical protein
MNPSNVTGARPTSTFAPSVSAKKVWGTPLGPNANDPGVRFNRSSPT